MRSLYYRCGVEIIMIESVFLHSDDGGTDHDEVPVYLPTFLCDVIFSECADDDNGDDEDDD